MIELNAPTALVDSTMYWSKISALQSIKATDNSMIAIIISIIAVIITLIYTIVTAGLFILSFMERKRNRELAEMQLYLQIGQKLETEPMRNIYRSIINNTLPIHIDTGLIIHDNDQSAVIALLSIFEDMYMLYERNILEIRAINSGYAAMLLKIGSNQNLKLFVKYLRLTDQDCFNGFVSLYDAAINSLPENERNKYPSLTSD